MCFRDREEFFGFCKIVGKIMLVFTPLPIFIVGMCVSVHTINSKNIKQIIADIEYSIEKKANYTDFTYQAFSAKQENDNKYIDVLGIAQATKDSPLYFAAITFPIEFDSPLYDPTFYDTITNKSYVIYEYYNDKIVAAKTEFTYNFIQKYRCADEKDIYTYIKIIIDYNEIYNIQLINEIPNDELLQDYTSTNN